MEFKHIPVLLSETIEGLNINPDGIYIDGTIGGAGHSKEIIKRLSSKGFLIGIDKDDEALNAARIALKNFTNYKLIHGNHDNIKEILEDLGIEKVDGILLDLGVSSYQLDEKKRGFSYIGNERLDMRMDRSQGLSAYEVVNKYKEDELSKIIYEYGEEKFSKRIARNICLERTKKPIETTKELSDIISKSVPTNKEGHPAKKTFQAIRIEVNDELTPLHQTVIDSINCLKNAGRLCIITFHSLEDREVKKAYIEAEGKCTCPKDLPYCICGMKSYGKIINKKPIVATKEELINNSRAKSAKLRIFERREKR